MRLGKEKVKVEYQTLVVIWGGLLISQLMFVGLIYFLKPELFSFDASRPPMGSQPLITVVFAVAAIFVFILSFVLRNQYIRRAVGDHDPGCVQTGLTLGCALSEMCSILGVILAIAFGYQYFILWIALGFLGILLHFPRKGNLDAASF
ncbi:MAG TPA: hypothetical protein VK468_05555 [Pyrinomonadaceae bacterium]|nr:hypothetical protein [Pyrinomonadaceae bacterium]